MPSTWVTVASFSTPLEAHVVRGRLEAEGLATRIADEHLINADWLMSQALGGVKLQVEARRLAEAQTILGALDRQPAFEWGEVVPEAAEPRHCPYCGSGAVHERKGWWRLAMLALFLEQLPLPFARGEMQCDDCGRRFPR